MIEGVVSKLQAAQKGGKSRVCVLERSCRSTSITVRVHTCLCMWYVVYSVCVDVGVFVVLVCIYVCVHICTCVWCALADQEWIGVV